MNQRNHLRGGVAMAGATALALALVACGSGGDQPSGDGDTQEITFLTHWGPDQVSELEDAAAAFTADRPDVEVTVQAVPFANLLSTLRTQGASPSGPTMASIYDLWLPELARDSLAAPMPEDVASEVQSGWPENLLGAASVDDQLYGIPNEVDLYALNYNTRLLEQAGIEEPPTNWDELVDDAAALTDEADGVQGFGVITNWDSGVVHPFLSLAASNDGHLLDDTGAPALTSPNVEATAALYEQLVDAGSINPDLSAANANTTGPYLDAFANGKTAMIIMANWWQSALKDAMGDDYQDVATAPIPVGPDGSGSSSISYSWMTIVNGNATDSQQQAAWEFLSWLNGPDSGEAGSSAMGDILMGMGILPSSNADVEAHAEELSDPFLATYVNGLPDATPFPTVLGGAAATQALQEQVEALVFGQVDAGTAMSQANDAVAAALAAAG